MNKILEDISKKLGFPPEAVKVVEATEGLDANSADYAKVLKAKVTEAFAENSTKEFKLKSIAEILKKDHTEVLKASVSCGAMLSKDAGGEFWVVGYGLVRLIDKMNGVEAPRVRAKKAEPAVKAEDAVTKEIPAGDGRQLDLNDILGAGTIELKEEEKKMPKKEVEVKEEIKDAAKKPAAKTGKAALKALVNSNQEMDALKARKFLVQSKLKKVEEVAYMSDAEVSKIVNKDYAFLTVGNGTEQLNIAIPREELKKIDISVVAVL